MAEKEQSLQVGTTEPGKDKLYVETDITVSATTAGNKDQKVITFKRPFKNVPLVVGAGVMLDDEFGALHVLPTATNVTFTLAQVEASGMSAAAKSCFVTLEGELA